jgi:O-antigen ligase
VRTLALAQWRVGSLLPASIIVIVALILAPYAGWAIAEENWFLAGLAAVLAMTPIALRWPMAAFGAYAFLVPFESVSLMANTGGATITRLIGIVAAAALVASAVVRRRFIAPPVVALSVVVLVLWALLTSAWAIDFDLSRAQLSTAVSLAAMYLAAVSYRASESELRKVYVLTMSGGMLAALAIVMFGFEPDPANVARGTLAIGDQAANANGAAQNLILPLSMAIAMLLTARRSFGQLVALAAVASIGAGLFLTVSRATLAAVVLMLCVLLYRFRVRGKVLAVVGILAVLLPLMPAVFFERIGLLYTGEDVTGSGRTEIWDVGFSALQRFGVYGAGFANFPAAYRIYANTDRVRGSHNAFLGTWVELGVVGLAIFVVALLGHLHLARTRDNDSSRRAFAAAIEAACFGFLFIGFFGDMLWRKAFWMSWILVVWAHRVGKTARTSSNLPPTTGGLPLRAQL